MRVWTWEEKRYHNNNCLISKLKWTKMSFEDSLFQYLSWSLSHSSFHFALVSTLEIVHSFNVISGPISLDFSFIVLMMLFTVIVSLSLSLLSSHPTSLLSLHRLQKTFVLWFVLWLLHSSVSILRLYMHTQKKQSDFDCGTRKHIYKSTMRFYCLKYYLLGKISIKFYVPFSEYSDSVKKAK